MLSREHVSSSPPLASGGEERTGAVLVVGGGIAGMQASLDLADAGYRVYLVEREPAIGGAMAQLDKTFPTNDCAMCILSPKLVDCGRHLNIDVLTCSELEHLSGAPGGYIASVRRRPRYVVEDDCTGCGDCAAVCPVIRPDAFNLGLSERRAAYIRYPQAMPSAYAIEKAGRSPCRDACPIGQRAQGYIALVREGRFADAYTTIKEDNPFPSVCGRVCNHVCETSCTRSKVDSPVSIRDLKRFVADWAADHLEEIQAAGEVLASDEGNAPESGRVAIVGAGPAGLACADRLVRLGHAVTVFEAQPVAGGMMRTGIPEHRLPRTAVDREVGEIRARGVEILVGKAIDDAVGLLEEYGAVFVAVGAQRGMRLPIPGAELSGVSVATDFLRSVAIQATPRLESSAAPDDVRGRRILVLGGGSVAIDCATSALRLGASWVGVACLESREAMPAHSWEVEDAIEEGVEVFPSMVFKEIVGTQGGIVQAVRCAQIDFRGFSSGRPEFDEISGTEQSIAADKVIFAVGQRPDVSCLPSQARHRDAYAMADPVTLATPVPGVFAGGDAVTGTGFLVDAIAAGQLAAGSIDAYLRGGDPAPASSAVPAAELTEIEAADRVAAGQASSAARVEPLKCDSHERVRDFREVYASYSEQQALAEANRCLSCGVCSECLQCVLACQKDCIDHDMAGSLVDLEVGAVVLAPGLQTMQGDVRPEYGYGSLPNVVTSIEFERMLSASGPWRGVLTRPSDGGHPRRLAFIQCVGSRDCSIDHGYCSSVCCMVAAKEAAIAREHDPQVEATIFAIDVRSYGKGFEQYVARAERDPATRVVRSAVSRVTGVPGSGDLRVRYASGEGNFVEETFDLVVLSMGLRPAHESDQLAQRAGISLNQYGFAEPPPFVPAGAGLAGGSLAQDVFVAGTFGRPMDIPETVISASCAAASVSSLLAGSRGSMATERTWPAERDVGDAEPRIGVFICHCGINIGGIVDVPQVVRSASMLPGVAYAEENIYTCSQDTQDRIREHIENHDLNRVVVASCTPRTHEPLFQETIRAAGLNPHLFQMANIREQVSWVHKEAHLTATEKAIDLVRMAVAKSRRLRPLNVQRSPVVRRALVVGGGLAGMTAAISVAGQGFPVTIVERDEQLGGNLRHVLSSALGAPSGNSADPHDDPQALLERLLRETVGSGLIDVQLGVSIEDVSGYVGAFATTIRMAGGTMMEIQHGATIIATGAQQHEPRDYLYGGDARVISQRELEARLARDATQKQTRSLDPESVVMIQCVGSRNDEHPYCSRVCCSEAIKNALAIKRKRPGSRIYVLYRDIRTYGFRERAYREARRQGVIFLEYSADAPPRVRDEDGKLWVDLLVQPEAQEYSLPADLVVLSAGIVPDRGNASLAQLLHVPLDDDGFFLEAHAKLRPLDCAAEGIFICGMAHSPRSIDETIAQAQGAAIRAVRLLCQESLEATPVVANVSPRLCSACGQCVEVCPYDARVLEAGGDTAQVITVQCQGCGACVVACPNKASQLAGFRADQLYAMLSAMDDAPIPVDWSEARSSVE